MEHSNKAPYADLLEQMDLISPISAPEALGFLMSRLVIEARKTESEAQQGNYRGILADYLSNIRSTIASMSYAIERETDRQLAQALRLEEGPAGPAKMQTEEEEALEDLQPVRVRLEWMPPEAHLEALWNGTVWNGHMEVWLRALEIELLDIIAPDGILWPGRKGRLPALLLQRGGPGESDRLFDIDEQGHEHQMASTVVDGVRYFCLDGWTFEKAP